MTSVSDLLHAIDDYFGGDGACWPPLTALAVILIIVGVQCVR
jgi:hypothetical protein